MFGIFGLYSQDIGCRRNIEVLLVQAMKIRFAQMHLIGEPVNRVFLQGFVIYLISELCELSVVWSVQIRVICDFIVLIDKYFEVQSEIAVFEMAPPEILILHEADYFRADSCVWRTENFVCRNTVAAE